MELNNNNFKKMALNNNNKKTSVPCQSSTLPRPEFLCLICSGTMSEETRATCGHVFCAACIRIAVNCEGRCPYPTCKTMFQTKGHLRVYF